MKTKLSYLSLAAAWLVCLSLSQVAGAKMNFANQMRDGWKSQRKLPGRGAPAAPTPVARAVSGGQDQSKRDFTVDGTVYTTSYHTVLTGGPSGVPCDTYDGCCDNLAGGTSPSSTVYCCTVFSKRSLSRDFTGQILDPVNAARYLISPYGTFTHTNGSMQYDRIYALRTRQQLERRARQNPIRRFINEKMRAVFRVLPKSIVLRRLAAHLAVGDGLLAFSPKFAVVSEDGPAIVKEMLKLEWDSFALHHNTFDRDTVIAIDQVFDSMGGNAHAQGMIDALESSADKIAEAEDRS